MALTQELSKALPNEVGLSPKCATQRRTQKQADKLAFHTARPRQKKKSFEHLGHFSMNACPNYIQIEHDPVALPTGLNQCLWQPEENFDEGTK